MAVILPLYNCCFSLTFPASIFTAFPSWELPGVAPAPFHLENFTRNKNLLGSSEEGSSLSGKMSLRDLVEGEAIMDDDENDQELADEYDGEGHQGAGTTNHYNDSSEEEDEEEDDEEAARAVSIGLILGFQWPC